jgi:hypothetical protein
MSRLSAFFLTASIVFLGSVAPAAAVSGDGGIAAFLAQSAHSWNYGNLDAFMSSYENSPATVYISSKTVIHGYAAIEAHYASRYGLKHRGVLSFSGLSERLLGTDYAVAIAHWHLALADGTHPTGIFSLVLHRSHGEWHIIADHSP